MARQAHRLFPLTGLLFVVVAVVAFAIVGDSPGTDEPAGKVVKFWIDNDTQQNIGAIVEMLGALLLIFYGAYLRSFLREAAGPRSALPTVVFGGAVVFATGLAIDGTLALALTDAADDIDPAAVQALNALFSNDYLPFGLGVMTMMLSLGLSIVASGALPRWLGWIAILLAVISATPIGFVGFLGGSLLLAVISVILTIRARPRGELQPAV